VVADFIVDIDRHWNPAAETPIPVRIIGSTALLLQTNYVRGTRDSDVIRSDAITEDVARRLLALAGKDTKLFERHRMYIELVHSGILFRRQKVEWIEPAALNARLTNFHVEVMSVVDVVVSKLKRLHQNDLDDIAAMVDLELVTHEALIATFREAVDFTMDAKADDLPKFRANLHRVERDMFGIEEPTVIELPSWIDDE
jgi:hypothetical protein